jgi:hypothetical protein
MEKGMGEVAIVRRSIRRGTYRKRQYRYFQRGYCKQLWGYRCGDIMKNI